MNYVGKNVILNLRSFFCDEVTDYSARSVNITQIVTFSRENFLNTI